MPTADEIRDIAHRYVRMLSDTDIAGIASLYAEDCTGEDPVGAPPHQGKEALMAFYAATSPMLHVEITGPVCVSGHEVAFPVRARVTTDENTKYIDAIDVLRVDDDGLITSFKAYWNPADLRDTP